MLARQRVIAAQNPHWPGGTPADIAERIAHELRLIAELGSAPYFLTMHEIVRFVRDRDILCQGRGSAANSAVCYVLGITAVDPARHDLLFERFVSASWASRDALAKRRIAMMPNAPWPALHPIRCRPHNLLPSGSRR